MKETARYFLLGIIVFSFSFLSFDEFKEEQKKFPRVRKAYEEKWISISNSLKNKGLDQHRLNLYIRVFKTEKLVELWAKNRNDACFKLVKEFQICNGSGSIGPKRMRGDLQVPEGFYHLDRFNPSSNYYLSLGINYPNKSDKILGKKNALGGDIFMHGACVTIGCLPLTDDKIKELYIYCVEAKSAGQTIIPITIFPRKLNKEAFEDLVYQYSKNSDFVGLWTDLKKGYDHFNKTKTLPQVVFLENGKHKVN